MPIYKIQAGRKITVEASTYVGAKGSIWYDESAANLRIGDGVTPGGLSVDKSVIQSDTAPDPSATTIWYNSLNDTLNVHSQGQWKSISSSGGGGNEYITGSQGLTGYVGSQGNIGFAGSAGLQGNVGFVGSTGAQGIQGDVGFTGSQGIQGNVGFTGSQGDIGYTGSRGIQGDVGFTGSQGIQGNIGYVGSKGQDGTSVKIVGSVNSAPQLPDPYLDNIGDGYITSNDGHLHIWTGSSWEDVGTIVGPQGDTGYTGSQGIQGDVGFTGSQGIQGDVGFTGSQGIQGDIGYTGSQGIQGNVGFTGSIGAQGIQGDIGFTGSTGALGDIGFTGSQGATGPQGPQGAASTTAGPQGPQGIIGYTGSGIQDIDLSSVDQNIIPAEDSVYDLGTADKQWRSLYVSSNTIYINSTPITVDENGILLVDGNLVAGVGFNGSQGYTGYVGSQGQGADLSAVAVDVLPTADNTYNLGSPDYQWSNLYVGTSTIYLAGQEFSITAEGKIFINGAEIVVSSTSSGILNLTSGTGVLIDSSTETTTISIGQDVSTSSNVTFADVTVNTLAFPDGSVQRTKAPQMYTNADAALGLTLDDLYPGDYYYDDSSESIYIMVDTGLGYFQLLDLTVRA